MTGKVKSMQRSGTEAIRTQNSKREINNITNSQNTKRTFGQPSEQLFPKWWPLSNQNRTKNDMYTHKVKRHKNYDTKNRQQKTTTKLPPWNGTEMNYRGWGGGGGGLTHVLRCQPCPQFLKWYKTFSWLFGSHDNHLIRHHGKQLNCRVQRYQDCRL